MDRLRKTKGEDPGSKEALLLYVREFPAASAAVIWRDVLKDDPGQALEGILCEVLAGDKTVSLEILKLVSSDLKFFGFVEEEYIGGGAAFRKVSSIRDDARRLKAAGDLSRAQIRAADAVGRRFRGEAAATRPFEADEALILMDEWLYRPDGKLKTPPIGLTAPPVPLVVGVLRSAALLEPDEAKPRCLLMLQLLAEDFPGELKNEYYAKLLASGLKKSGLAKDEDIRAAWKKCGARTELLN